MIDVIKKSLLAGVGAAIITKEKAETALSEFVRQGKISAADAKIMADKIAEQGRREFEEISQTLGARLSQSMEKSESTLAARIRALEARIEVLENRITPPPTRSGEP